MNTNNIQLMSEISDSLNGQRLDIALSQLFSEYSRGQIQQWIRAGFVTLDGAIIQKPRTTVKAQQQVMINAQLVNHENWDAQPIPLNIIYEDSALIVINKPVGLVVHPGAGNPDQTLINALLHYAPELATLPRAGIIHRLDKDTSGILVIARSLTSHHALVKMMQEREIHREYRAVVLGHMISGGTVDAPIGRHPVQRIKMAVVGNGKPAVTHYRVLQRFAKHTLLAVQLETGRTHQIRVHLSHIGYPIVGDPVYGKRGAENKNFTLSHQALHAYRLCLTHPITGEAHEWIADMPDDMLALIDKLSHA